MTLEQLGLRAGEAVRWRPKAGARHVLGSVTGVERDGSIGLTDAHGKARALPIERLEVRAAGPRGARTWEPLAERVARTEQMELFR